MTKNNPKYRNNSLNPAHLSLILDLVNVGAYNALSFILIDTEKLSREEYHDWVSSWKEIYNGLSADINSAKKEGKHQEVHSLRIIANTLINSRQYARDRRRSAIQRVNETSVA